MYLFICFSALVFYKKSAPFIYPSALFAFLPSTYRRIGHTSPCHGFWTPICWGVPSCETSPRRRDGPMQPCWAFRPHHFFRRIHHNQQQSKTTTETIISIIIINIALFSSSHVQRKKSARQPVSYVYISYIHPVEQWLRVPTTHSGEGDCVYWWRPSFGSPLEGSEAARVR